MALFDNLREGRGLFGLKGAAEDRADQRALDRQASLRNQQQQFSADAIAQALGGQTGPGGVGPPVPGVLEQSPELAAETLSKLGAGGPIAQGIGQNLAAGAFSQPMSPAERQKLESQAAKARFDALSAEVGADTKIRENQIMQLTGGRQYEPWLADKRMIQEYGLGMQHIEDLRSMNREIGREVLPGNAKGVYDFKRSILLKTLADLFDAGALQQAELEFLAGMLPEFGAFSSWSPEKREAKLREFLGELKSRTGILVGTTANTAMPDVVTRDLHSILGEPPAPAGTQLGQSTLLGDFSEQISSDLKDVKVPDFVNRLSDAFGRSVGPVRTDR